VPLSGAKAAARRVEVRRAQDVARATRDVARLRIRRPAGLLLPQPVVLLGDQAQLAVGFAVARRVVAGIAVARRVGPVAGGQRVQELGQLRFDLAADGGDAERRERDDVAVPLAHPVDQPVAAGVADQDVQAGAAEGAVLVGGMRVRRVVDPAVGGDHVVGVQEVVAPAAVEVVAARAADHPVVAEVAEHHVVAVARHLGEGERRAIVREGHRAVDQLPFRRELVQEVLGARRRAGLPHRAVGVEQDHAPRVVLVVQVELAEPAGHVVVHVPRVRVRAEVQDVARVPGPRPVRAHQADHRAARPVLLDVGLRQGLPARHRVVARAAVQEVVAQAAEDHVVRGVGVEQRIVAGSGVRLNGVMSTVLRSAPPTLITAVCTCPGV